MTPDLLIDRIRLKNQLNKWRFLTLALILFCIFAALKKDIKPLVETHGYIARIAIEGIITENRKRDKEILRLADNDSVKAVLVYINSPGGTTVGSEEIYYSIREIAANKPVVAIMGSAAASGGYMAALAADYIVARQSTITGSIGVLMQTAEVTELAKKLGINLHSFKSSPLKASTSPLEKITPETEIALNALIKDTYDYFVSMIVERRKLPLDTVLKLADGRVYTGNQAFQHKLVDAIGGEKEAKEWLIESKKINKDLPVKDINVNKKHNVIKEMFDESVESMMKNPYLLETIFSVKGILAL